MQIFIILNLCTPSPVDKFSLRYHYTPNDQAALTHLYDQSSLSIRLFEGMVGERGKNKERKTDTDADISLRRIYTTFGYLFLGLVFRRKFTRSSMHLKRP